MDFRILVDGKDETKTFRGILKSIKTLDNEGVQSDTATIDLIDKQNISFPKVGKKLEIFFAEKRIGTYTVSRVQATSSNTITISAKANDYKSEMTTVLRKRKWETSLGNVVLEIAKVYGLNSFVPEEVRSLVIREMQSESDAHFLTRIAKERRLVFKADATNLALHSKENPNLPTVRLEKIYSWTYEESLLKTYTGIKSFFLDTKTGERVEVNVGDPSNQYVLDLTWSREEEAKAKASNKLAEFSSQKKYLTTVSSFLPVSFGQKVEITACREGVDGTWVVLSVEHQLDQTGAKTTLKLGAN